MDTDMILLQRLDDPSLADARLIAEVSERLSLFLARLPDAALVSLGSGRYRDRRRYHACRRYSVNPHVPLVPKRGMHGHHADGGLVLLLGACYGLRSIALPATSLLCFVIYVEVFCCCRCAGDPRQAPRDALPAWRGLDRAREGGDGESGSSRHHRRPHRTEALPDRGPALHDGGGLAACGAPLV